MINDDITRQIAADYARLLTSNHEGFDLTLAEAIDSDLLPEDVLAQLCEMFVEAYYPTGNALNRPDGSKRKWSGTGNSGKNLLRRQQQIADIVVAREQGKGRINPLGASRDKPVSARDNMSSLYARGEAQSAAARHGFNIKPTITNFGRGSSTVQGNGKLQAGWRNNSRVGNTVLQKGSSQQRRGQLATDSIERNKTQMGVENKNSLLSRFQNIFNKRKEQGITGAAAQSSALKPLNRRVIASQAKLGDAAGQETIRRDINKTGLKDKLRAAGIDTKVRVRVDKTTGHYHVTDKTGKTHVIESRNTVPRGPDHPDSAIGRVRLYGGKRKGITMSPETRARAVAAEKKSGNTDFLPKRQRAALYKKREDSYRQFVSDANSRKGPDGKPLNPYDNDDS